MPPLDDELTTLKARKEIEKLDVDIVNARANLGLERFKTWAALLGPVMTAVTVLGTVYVGYLQLSSKRQADEDGYWRQTIMLLNDTRPEDFGSKHVATLLKPFFESARYRQLARGVAVDALPRLRDINTFQDLFSAAFPQPSLADLPTILDIGRKQNLAAIAALSKMDERNVINTEIATLCAPIATILRNNSHKSVMQQFYSGNKAKQTLPFNDMYFEKCDFSGLDLSGADFTGSAFDAVDLDGATLVDMSFDADKRYMWNGTVWWTAKTISPDLLRVLISQFKPYKFADGFAQSYRDDATIAKEDWERNVLRLCAAAHLLCTDDEIHVNFPKPK